MEHNNDHSGDTDHKHDHILPYSLIMKIGGALLVLTVITVWVAQIDLGHWNFIVAMAVATIKGLLVALFFMGLKYDKIANGAIFATSFVFLAIFVGFTSTDIFFRGDVYVKPGDLTANAAGSVSHLKNPWVATPELIARGKDLFQANCVTCHGAEGKGNGISGVGLKPPPRNFTLSETETHWDNGRSVPMVFKTLREGVAGTSMASFATLPVDDRWALDHYVLSLGPTKVPTPTEAELAKAGISTTGEEKKDPTVPVDFAIDRMVAEHSQGT